MGFVGMGKIITTAVFSETILLSFTAYLFSKYSEQNDSQYPATSV